MRRKQIRTIVRFSTWLRATRLALARGTGVEVPCGTCRACCTSSYFIHISPRETRTLARIPKKFLTAAPGLPKGHVLLGYFENGHCPLFVENACSVYAFRSLTCRNYDCRIFAATGLAAGGPEKAEINRKARSWKFAYPTQRDRDQQTALRATVKFLQARDGSFPAGFVPRRPSVLAVFAIKVYGVFLRYLEESGEVRRALPERALIKAIMRAYAKFEQREAGVLKQ